MPAIDHPEYRQEKAKLDRVIAYIEERLAKPAIPSMAANSRSAVAISNVRLGRRDDLIGARAKPFFARLDAYLADTPRHGPPETFRLGHCEVMDEGVYSWADDNPLVRLYYQPHGIDGAFAHLTRAIDIANDDIIKIDDRYVHPNRAGAAIKADSDAHLRSKLEQTKSDLMGDVVSSLQPEQYALVASPADRMLLVQGCPGSGKTEVALHRVAWLLHQSKTDRARQRVLILGPSPVFMRYVSRVLPDLGWHDVQQDTFRQWALAQFDQELDVATMEDSLECLLDERLPKAARAQHHASTRIKGSQLMGDILDAYVNELAQQIEESIEPLSTEIRLLGHEPIAVRISRERFAEVLDGFAGQPLNLRKAEAVRRLANALTFQLSKPTMEASTRGELRRQLFAIVQRHLRTWRALNTRSAYRDLLTDSRRLFRLGRGELSATECELLTLDGPDLGHAWSYSDLPPLLYLHQALNGNASERYDHVVIDEAQDVPPLLYRCVSACMGEHAMIAVGDTNQSIFAPMGLPAWADITRSAGLMAPEIASLRTSYRATRQITEYANQVLMRLGTSDADLAKAFDRPGQPVLLHQCEDQEHQTETIVRLIRQTGQDQPPSTAVICKTAARATVLVNELVSKGLDCLLLTSQDALSKATVTVVPAYATKGLEFDHVILADADASTFGANLRDGRLLYVAITRAAHRLDICWCGDLAPLLAKGTAEQGDRLDPRSAPRVTIEAYAEEHPADADALVLELAATDRLWLLRDGRINETLLALMDTEKA